MPTKRGYTVAKKLILDGTITNISELLEIVDKTPLSKDIKTTPERFNRMLADPTIFSFGDAFNMAAVIGVDDTLIMTIIHNEALAKRKKKK